MGKTDRQNPGFVWGKISVLFALESWFIWVKTLVVFEFEFCPFYPLKFCLHLRILLTILHVVMCIATAQSLSRQKDKSGEAALKQRQNRSIPCAIVFCCCFFFTDCCYYDGVIHLQGTDTAVSQKRFPAAFSATTVRLGETSLKCTYGLKGLWNQISCLYSYSSCSCFIAVLHSPLNNLLSASCRPAASDPRANEKSVYMKPWRLNGAFIVYRSQERKGSRRCQCNAHFVFTLREKAEGVRWKCICSNDEIV